MAHQFQVSPEQLWCECNGNSSSTPLSVLISERIKGMHENAKELAFWYVIVVISVYVIGLVIIIGRSSRERHTFFSALSSCFTPSTGVRRRRTNRSTSRRDTEGQSQHPTFYNRMSVDIEMRGEMMEDTLATSVTLA